MILCKGFFLFRESRKLPPEAVNQAIKPLLEVLSGKTLAAPPVWLMRQAGRYLPEYRKLRAGAGSFLDLCYDADLAAEATLQPIRRYGFDAAIIFSDILVIPHALGREVAFEEGRGPVLEPISDAGAIAALDASALAERLDPVYRAIEKVAAALPERVALIGFAGAPWTIATYMVEGGTSRDHAAVRRFAYERPEAFDRLIDALTEAVTAHLIAQVDAGAEAVQIFDTWAGVLPAAYLRRYSIEPIRRIAEAVRDSHPRVPVIAFPRGVGAAYETFAALDALAAVSVDTGVDPAWAARALQPLAAVQGNLDPVMLIAGGGALDEAALAVRSALAGRPHVFNLGHGIMPATPPEHVARLLEVVRKAGA